MPLNCMHMSHVSQREVTLGREEIVGKFQLFAGFEKCDCLLLIILEKLLVL